MGDRQRSWDHSFACAWHDGEPCTCKDASDRPLTAGEGNTARDPLAEAHAKIALAREQGGVLLEALVRGHACCMINDSGFDQALWDEAWAECGRLREQLDAARNPAETQRRIATIRENVEHIARGCRASTGHNPAPYLNSIEAALDALARAALGVEGPAG